MSTIERARAEHRQAQRRWHEHFSSRWCQRCRDGLWCATQVGLDRDASASGVRLTMIEHEQSRRAVGAGR